VTIAPGVPVLSSDNQQVGAIAEIVTTDEGTATHLVVTHDLPAPDRAVPITFIEHIGEYGVRLGVDQATVGGLPPLDRSAIPEDVAVPTEQRPATSHRHSGAYHLQEVLTNLVGLTLHLQHVRWNLAANESGLRRQFDDFDALTRAGADEIAARLRQLGIAPDGRTELIVNSVSYPSLSTGPMDAQAAVSAFTTRLAQLASHIRESVSEIEVSDSTSAEVLRALSEELLNWTTEFEVNV
jgi:DNA-binding ferritin-like protein